jgi:capsule polysaccharide modification protein KpsS
MIEELDDQDEATHVNMNETEEEVQGEGPAFDDNLEFDADHIEIEGDRVFMAMVHPVDPQHFVRASSTVSRRLAEASTKNSTPKGFREIVPTALHSYEDVFSEMAFDTLPQHRKWDHAIELEHEPSPGFRKVYPMMLM